MRVVTRSSFGRDLRKVRDAKVRDKVEQFLDAACAAKALGELPHVLPMTDHEGYYRVRVGKYRIGLYLDGESLEIVRVLPRRDFYRVFP